MTTTSVYSYETPPSPADIRSARALMRGLKTHTPEEAQILATRLTVKEQVEALINSEADLWADLVRAFGKVDGYAQRTDADTRAYCIRRVTEANAILHGQGKGIFEHKFDEREVGNAIMAKLREYIEAAPKDEATGKRLKNQPRGLRGGFVLSLTDKTSTK